MSESWTGDPTPSAVSQKVSAKGSHNNETTPTEHAIAPVTEFPQYAGCAGGAYMVLFAMYAFTAPDPSQGSRHHPSNRIFNSTRASLQAFPPDGARPDTERGGERSLAASTGLASLGTREIFCFHGRSRRSMWAGRWPPSRRIPTCSRSRGAF